MQEESLFTMPLWKIKGIRELKIRFDSVEKKEGEYILYRDGSPIGRVDRQSLDDKDKSKMDSLAEHKPV